MQAGRASELKLVGASQIARESEVRQSPNGVRYATYGETGVADVELDRMLEAVPTAITSALQANTYYFVPLTMHETAEEAGAMEALGAAVGLGPMLVHRERRAEPTMISSGYTAELSDAAICHRNVDLEKGRRGVFISTRLMGDRFALSFEFFINVAHAFADGAGVPAAFEELVWQQALDHVRGETSADAWEMRNMAFGRAAQAPSQRVQPMLRRNRGTAFSFAAKRSAGGRLRALEGAAAKDGFGGGEEERRAAAETPVEGVAALGMAVEGMPAHGMAVEMEGKERALYLGAAFSDAVAIYLLSLALDFDYAELREREYPLLTPGGLAARLRLIAEMYPPNEGYEFAVRYRRKA